MNTVEDAPQTTHHTLNDKEVTVRPIRHTDQMIEKEFINRLSDEAKHFRFFGGIGELRDEDLAAFCDVDYHDSMAFVAVVTEKDETREVGVVRYCKENDGSRHEMAITIADDYRDSALPTVLLTQLVEYARTHDVNTLYSIELYNNKDMHRLATKFDMKKEVDPDDQHQVIYTLSVS